MSTEEFLIELIFSILFVVVPTAAITAAVWSICHFSGILTSQANVISGIVGLMVGLCLVLEDALANW